METLKVFAVIDSLGFGGAERLLSTQAQAGLSAGLELAVSSLTEPGSDNTIMVRRLADAGVHTGTIGVHRLAHPLAVHRVAEAIRNSGCDVVHAHLGYSATLVPFAARLANRPSVCTLHTMPQRAGGRDAVKERLCVETASRSGAFIFVSQAAQAAYGARYRIRPSWKVVHNGIDLQIWRPGLARLPYRLGVPVGAPVVSIVAALRAPKGHSLAVDAWPAVLAQVPEARLVIVGDGDEEPNLRNQVRRAGLQDRVIFAGRVSDERETADIVRASDVVLLPSYTEALPTTLIEAAACARAVVATDVGGVREVVRDGISGIVIPPADPARIAAAVVELLLDPDRRAQLGAAGEVLARERFDMRVWARALRAVYEGAICRGPAVARSARQELRSST